MEKIILKENKLLNALLIVLGLLVFLSFPLLLVFGLMLMGLPIILGFGSWLGSFLVSLFFVMVFRLSQFKTK